MRRSTRPWIVVPLALNVAASAAAFDFVVTEYADDALSLDPGCTVDHCTLREAVIAANAGADADRILLSAGTYALTIVGAGEQAAATGDLDLVEDVEIIGPGAPMTAVQGGLERAFHLVAPGPTVRFAGLSITGGGDAVFASAVHLLAGALTVEECEVRDNPGNAPAILVNQSTADLFLRRSALIGNGGPALSLAAAGQAFVENTTMSGATAQIQLNANNPSVSCEHCTIVNSTGGAAIFVNGFNGATVELGNSIVAGACSFINGGAVTSLGGNVQSTGTTCALGQANDQDGVAAVDLDLGAVADNGGPTRTRLPGGASVAVGNALDATCLQVAEQRGVVRTTTCESGATELTGTALATPIFADGFLQGDPDAWSPQAP